jgi:hypothetical protein
MDAQRSRCLVATGVVGLLAVVWPSHVRAGAVDEAVGRGVKFLIEQQHDDGSISTDDHKTAMSSLSVLAMAAVGHLPAEPTVEGQAMRQALAYVLAEGRQDDKGYYGNADGSDMYGHGITTLVLASMLGMGVDAEQDQLIRRRLDKALELTLAAQTTAARAREDKYIGGWRYKPDSHDADMSLTCWQLMSLRSARNAGVKIPAAAIERATDFIERCYDQKTHQFGYTPGHDHRYSDTAMAVLSLQVSGHYEAGPVIQASDWLLKYELDWADEWFMYGTYYYAQGMNQRGGRHAQRAQQAVSEVLLEHQNDDGSWQGRHRKEKDKVYSTCMALLALSVKYHYLPIYQR